MPEPYPVDRRTKSYKDLAKFVPSIREIMTEEIDGEVFEYQLSNHCRICTSSPVIRNYIDDLLVWGEPYIEVYRKMLILAEQNQIDGTRISYGSIRSHQKKHLPFDKMAYREMVERRAIEKGKSILNAKNNLLGAEAFLEVIRQKAWNGLIEGSINPSLKEGMEAAILLDRLEKDATSTLSTEDLYAQLNAIILAVKEVVSPDQQKAILERINQHLNTTSANEKVIEIAVESEDYGEWNREDYRV